MLEAEGGPCFLVSIISWRRANKLVFSWAFYPVKHVQLLWSFTSVLLTSPSVNLWWSCWLFLFAYFSNFMATLLGYQEWHANQTVASLSASCCQTTPLQLTSHRWHGLIQVQAFWYLCKQHTPQCLTVLLLLLFFFGYQYAALSQPSLYIVSSGAFTQNHSHLCFLQTNLNSLKLRSELHILLALSHS